jgi:hypothetical protein
MFSPSRRPFPIAALLTCCGSALAQETWQDYEARRAREKLSDDLGRRNMAGPQPDPVTAARDAADPRPGHLHCERERPSYRSRTSKISSKTACGADSAALDIAETAVVWVTWDIPSMRETYHAWPVSKLGYLKAASVGPELLRGSRLTPEALNSVFGQIRVT